MLEPTKKDTLHPKTKKKQQRDSRRGTITIKSNLIYAGWVTHKLEKLYHSPPTGVKVLSSQPGGLATGGGAPRESGFEGQWGLITGIPQDWGKQKLHSWRTHKGSCVYQDPGKKVVTS